MAIRSVRTFVCKASLMGLALAAAQSPPARAADPIQLSLPLVCEPHKDCFIQNYFDDEQGSGVHDYLCGGASYDTHDGIDFRLISAAATKANVAVVASADGVVKGLRDGVPDIFKRDNNAAAVKGRECGNGVVLDHGNGWETQYCHMKMGTVVVASGQAVKRGDRLGSVGFSGQADFAHVHLTVRHNGRAIDPFWANAAPGADACHREGATDTLWQPSVVASFPYRTGEIIGSGFSAEPLDLNTLELDHTAVTLPNGSSPVIRFYGRFINLLAGDRIRITVAGPGGSLIESLAEPLTHTKATYLGFAGVKRKTEMWTAGRYEGRVEIVRDGAVAASSSAAVDIVGDEKK